MEGEHAELLGEAIAADGEGQRRLLAGDEAGAAEAFAAAARAYRSSWEVAPPHSYGRLVGLMKAAVLAGDGGDEAAYVREQLGGGCDSPPACWALALAALATDDDETAARAADGMRGGGAAFARAAEAVAAVAARDEEAWRRTAEAIVNDFSGREEHLTGVAIADTTLVLARLAARRGLAAPSASPLLPPG